MPWRDVILYDTFYLSIHSSYLNRNTYNLETRDLRLQGVVKNLLQSLMVEDSSIRDALFAHYFKHRTSVTLGALTGYAELQTTVC